MNDYISSYEFWCKNATDSDVLNSLALMKNDEDKKSDAFYKDIEFGTGGLRGIMEAGTNRMNVYTVFRATTGVAMYMKKHGFSSCAITYDSRNNSKKFSQVAAATLASHGIKVYLTKECMPTPFLSFMVRSYKADMGINVTASHNASQYNGYKVYDSNGCQLTDDGANEVMQHILTVDPFERALPNFAEWEKDVVYSDQQTEEKYIQAVLAESLGTADVSVMYSPLNGAGYRIVPKILRSIGVTISVVEEQSMPDGNFSTCPYPNPEKAEALSLALSRAKNVDLVVANDPDSDRLGVAVCTEQGNRILNGNEVGELLCDYVLSVRSQRNSLPQNPVVVKTIVSTPMADKIAAKYGATVVDVLTGFKYIGSTINKLEKQGHADDFVFGFEESCGYLKGSYVRDKDGVVAAMLVCECAAYYKKQGKTLLDRLQELSKEFGNYVFRPVSYTFAGVEGTRRKEEIFRSLREDPLQKVGDGNVMDACDFLTQTKYDMPKANVLRYRTDNDCQVILRPSGTEPLIKCYLCAVGDGETANQKLDAIVAQLNEIFR